LSHDAEGFILKAPRGFTLIEVLVALTIASVALLAALRATSTLTQGLQDMRQRTYALWSAENRLATIRVVSEWPEVGRRQFDCSQGGILLVCDEEVFATPNPFFRRVEVMFPILAPELKQRVLREIVPTYLADHTRARELDEHGVFHLLRPAEGQPAVRCQIEFLERRGAADTPGAP
jgi:general secretion pathway protein I